MKQIFLLSLIVAFNTGMLSAQNPGCDGSRYIDDVFSTVKKTTVNYAPTIGHLNNPMMLAMDIYEPIGDNLSARPVVVLAHGGSFVFGEKGQMQPWCELLAKKGYVAVSIQYRLFPVFVLGFPDSLSIFDTAIKAVGDMRAAVRFLREDAATANLYRIDSEHVFIGGYSAGAVIALHSGFLDEGDAVPAFLQTILENNEGLEGISGTAVNKTYDSSAKAVVNMSGGLYRKEWVDADNLPLVSIHGTADGTVNYVYGLAAGIAYLEGSSLLHERAESEELWNFLETVPGGGHTDIYSSVQYKPYVDTFWVQATTLLESLSCAQVNGTDAPASGVEWSVSPNPNAGESFILQLPPELPAADLLLGDLNGKTVLQLKNVANQALIPIQKLPKGVYIVQIQNPAQPAQRYPAQRLIRQ